MRGGWGLDALEKFFHRRRRLVTYSAICLFEIFSTDTRTIVKHLRFLCAEQIRQWPPEELLDYFISATFRYNMKTWQDQWNPVTILEECGLSCIMGYDTVRAVSDDPNGNEGDILLIVDLSDAHSAGQARQERQIRITQGLAYLNLLRQELQTVFQTCGNTHWADATDARMLAEALGIGFCTFADSLQGNTTRRIVSLDGSRGDYAYFLPIWWNEPTHFRAMEIQCTQSDTFRACWSADELPQTLIDLYNESNRTAPVLSRTNRASNIV